MGPLIALLAFVPVPRQEAPGPLQQWEAHIGEASARFGVPADWIRSVMLAESGGRTELGGHPIRSPKGAMGLMQVMPATYAEMARRHGLGPDPDLPRDNILAGTAYLRLMYERFGYPAMFAAYNAGPLRYAAFLRSGKPLPAETRAYLAKVSAGTLPEEGRAPARTVRSGAGIFFDISSAAGASAPETAPDPGLFVPLRRQ